MSTNNLLFNRPDLDQDVNSKALFLSGGLQSAKPLIPYEGRLQIHNGIGACFAEQIGGATLPPGSRIFVDNVTKEVVVAWPEYTEEVAPLPNGGFEDGLSDWSFETVGGTGRTAPQITTEYKDTGTQALRWNGGNGLGNEGGVELIATNSKVAQVYPGQRVNASVRVMYNPEGHHLGSRGRVRVKWLGPSGTPHSVSQGNQILGRGPNGNWNTSSLSEVTPEGAFGAQLQGWITARNGFVMLDTTQWDIPQGAAGTNQEATYCINIRVRDSGGRYVDWFGCIRVSGLGIVFTVPGNNVGTVDYSYDNGTSWTSVNAGMGTTEIRRVDCAGGNVYASGNGVVSVSTNRGISFAPITGAISGIVSKISYNETLQRWFIAYDNSTSLLSSSDGINFSATTTLSGFQTGFYAGDRIVWGGSNNEFGTSSAVFPPVFTNSTLPVSGGTYGTVGYVGRTATGYIISTGVNRHLQISPTSLPGSWVNTVVPGAGFSVLRMGSYGNVTIIMIAGNYRWSLDGGVTLQPAVPVGAAVTGPGNSSSGMTEIVFNGQSWFSGCNGGLGRLDTLGAEWLKVYTTSTATRTPQAAVLF